jgi:predicted DNA-binding protein
MAKKQPKGDTSKSAPGLVSIRLQLTPTERDRLRVIAAKAGRPMAIWCRDVVRAAMAKRKD